MSLNKMTCTQSDVGEVSEGTCSLLNSVEAFNGKGQLLMGVVVMTYLQSNHSTRASERL